MRILDKSSLALDLETLGMWPQVRDTMDTLLSKPHGMFLVTGPTGSGKTTTLYASLARIYDPQKKIITVEDPVEYELEGINQIPVNPKRGLDFAAGLRHILRQDPDIVLVGEIRDAETADIAIRSALTGHLILSTLHTNDAPSSVGRLVDMGVEPYLIASVLEGLLAQRLGRRICQDCREQVPIDEDISHRITEQERDLFAGEVWKGAGCEKCNQSGYRGRIGYYEILKVNATSRKAIADNLPVAEFKKIIAEDMQTMRRMGSCEPRRDSPQSRKSFAPPRMSTKRASDQMPTYSYHSTNSSGQSNSGTLTAGSRSEAIRQLMQRGETATRLEVSSQSTTDPETKPTSKGIAAKASRARPTMSKGDMATLIRELATALEAGLPLMQALRTIRKQATGRAAPAILDFMIERVEAELQHGLRQAFQRSGRRHAQSGGCLWASADPASAADLLERGVELRRELLARVLPVDRRGPHRRRDFVVFLIPKPLARSSPPSQMP